MKKLILSLTALVVFTVSYAQNTAADVIIKTKHLSTLEAALTSADLMSTLQGAGPFTVFAPTNTAFEKLAPGVLGNLLTPASHAQLVSVLKYHVMAGKWTTRSIVKAIEIGGGKAELTTIEGKIITATMVGKIIKLTDTAGNSAMISKRNKKTSSGFIQFIDTVLMPN